MKKSELLFGLKKLFFVLYLAAIFSNFDDLKWIGKGILDFHSFKNDDLF